MSTKNHHLLQELMSLDETELQLYLYSISSKNNYTPFEVLFTLSVYIEAKVFKMINKNENLDTILSWGNMANFLMKEVPIIYSREPHLQDSDFTRSVKFRGKSIKILNHVDNSFLDIDILIYDLVRASKSLDDSLFNVKKYNDINPEERVRVYNNIVRLIFTRNIIRIINSSRECIKLFNEEYFRISATNIFKYHENSTVT